MGQLIFFGLFIIALLAGAFSYFAPLQKPINPLKFMMEKTGFNAEEAKNQKRSLQVNMTTSNGLIKIRKQMDDLAIKQNQFLDTVQDQQEVLRSANQDLLRLNLLSSQMQDEQRLLVEHGQELVALSNQLAQSRQWIVDQIDLSNINSETSLRLLQQHYDVLKSEANEFFDKVNQHNQEIRDRMDKIQDQLRDPAIKERTERMLDKEHEDMIKLADSEERSRNLLKDARDSFAASKDLFNDSLRQTQDLIEEERQKQEDQEWISQQHVADQQQRMQDQQNR